MLTFYKIDAKHAHHRSPPQYINTSQYIQQRPNTIYRIGCQLLRIANTNIYRDTSVLIPVLRRVGLSVSTLSTLGLRTEASTEASTQDTLGLRTVL